MATIANQIKEALKARNMTQEDLANMMGITLRAIQRKLREGRFTSSELDFISKELDWQLVHDPYGRTSVQSNFYTEENSPSMEKPLTFSINLDRDTAKEFPGLVEEIEEIIKKFKSKR